MVKHLKILPQRLFQDTTRASFYEPIYNLPVTACFPELIYNLPEEQSTQK